MPRIPAWIQRKRVIIPISVSLMSMVALVLTQAKEHSLRIQDSAAATSGGTLPKQPVCSTPSNPDPLLGARIPTAWPLGGNHPLWRKTLPLW
jgi:hypothetical protein